jgi:hypothetical protein
MLNPLVRALCYHFAGMVRSIVMGIIDFDQALKLVERQLLGFCFFLNQQTLESSPISPANWKINH